MAWCASDMHLKITQQARPGRYCSQAGLADDVRALGSPELLAYEAQELAQFAAAAVLANRSHLPLLPFRR